ncbi:MAG TPA: HEAT repeat domain-containing protein [Polyangiaceae bacterium]|nr:HEAT repeat domain-containing protein [Polyangiaceae bacterium]
MSKRLRGLTGLSLLALVLSLPASAAATETDDPNTLGGRAEVYGSLQQSSLEHVTSASALAKELRFQNIAPTRIWKLLEHGEKVECLDCIPRVARLLYDSNAKTREISAWWLRRRIFGVFGKGEVYSQVLGVLGDANETANRRAQAANAIGEFLNPAGVDAVSKAALTDADAPVREASVKALERLNNEGLNQALGKALADRDERVQLAALHAAISVNVFSTPELVMERFGDKSALVRRRAAEAVGAMRLSDAVVGLVALSSEANEPSADVRAAAVWALGQIADPAAKPAVQAALSDSSSTVKNAATIALRRL